MVLDIPSGFYTSDALASIALLAILLLARLIAGRALRHRENLPEQVVRRWTSNLRNLLLLIAIIGLTMIWAPQLRTFAISLTAVAVALVVATKELLLCLSGAALRTFTRAYSVGDVIEIGTTKGEVIDLDLFATRLREIEPREGSMILTARTVILPHSLLFSAPTRVISQGAHNRRHKFDLTFEPTTDVFSLKDQLLGTARAAIEGTGARDVVLDFSTSDLGKYRIGFEVAGEAHDVPGVESAIACAIGALVHAHKDNSSRRDAE